MRFKEDAKFFYVDIEASNENVDLHGQTVLQSALLDAKDNFLKDGVISVDHKHRKRLTNKQVRNDERYVIGEPLSVYTSGHSTWVRGKLYKYNPLAKIIIELLRRESNKPKASIAGFFPQISIASDGKQTVTAFRWDDVSITTNPVNNSLSPVRGIKKSIGRPGLKIRKNKLRVTQRKTERAGGLFMQNEVVLPKKITVKKEADHGRC
jgi:hypothetical protein